MCAAARKSTKADGNPLGRALRAGLRDGAPNGVCIAYSGGPDSTALLHALALLPQARESGLRALHVDHGLHAASERWAEHCKAFCQSLDVSLHVVRVEIRDTRNEGTEAAARRARRVVFAEHLRDGEWLALAHHRDDQIETVLLKLLRGAGPEGLGGMRGLRPIARGSLWRPLLDIPRDTLRKYVTEHGLPCIDDPANDDPRFSRNILRHEILPRIAQHWPHADASILHAAQLCRTAAGYLELEAEATLPLLRCDADTLDIAGWLALPKAMRAPVLHRWLRELGLSTPADAQYRELEHESCTAAEDALPCVAWPGAEVRVWDDRLHATPPLVSPPNHWQTTWDGAPLTLPDGCGSLKLEKTDGDSTHAKRVCFDPPFVVRLRRGGERIKPAGDPHTRELRGLFQRSHIPPWVRERCPLICEGESLVAVADLWLNARGKAFFDAHGVRPRWNRPIWLNAP